MSTSSPRIISSLKPAHVDCGASSPIKTALNSGGKAALTVHQPAGCVVDEDQQRAAIGAIL